MCFLPVQFHFIPWSTCNFYWLYTVVVEHLIWRAVPHFTHAWGCRQGVTSQKSWRKPSHCYPVLAFHVGKPLLEKNDFTWKMTGLLSVKFPHRIFKKQSSKRWCGLFITSRIPFAVMAIQCMIFYNPYNFHDQTATLHYFFCWLIYLQVIYSSQDISMQLKQKNNVKAEYEWKWFHEKTYNSLAFSPNVLN